MPRSGETAHLGGAENTCELGEEGRIGVMLSGGLGDAVVDLHRRRLERGEQDL